MENKALQIETGLVTYEINGTVKITFNPTDSAFIEKLFVTFDALDEKQEAYKAEIEKAQVSGKKGEIFDIARKCDAEMRSMVDDVLGNSVCEALFGTMNVYALANGLPVWANLLLAIMDEIDTVFAQEQKLTNIRVKKYSSKYKK